ncbi:outer membrane protein [Paraburkholderia caledonica]|uniref:Outer membrane protein n=1 Tax=Paraburkholderia caledonica TaxID=134536 RepID=A0AB73ILV1_9BURK|nr:outer membrane protein [Paraburkholderia caledonica]
MTVSDGHDRAGVNSGHETVYLSKGYTIALRQNLFDATNWQAYKQAEASVARAGVEYNATQQLLMLQVCESYFAVLGAQDDLRFAAHNEQTLRDQLELTTRRYEEGDATIVDTQEAQAEFERASADVIAAESTMRARRADLRRRVGRDIGDLAVLGDDENLTQFYETDEDAWIDKASAQSLDVAQRQLTEYIAELELKKSRAAFLPTVSVSLSHSAGNLEYLNNQTSISTTGNTNSFRQGTTNVAMLQVSIPLFDGFSTLSKEREARAQKQKAAADLDDARLEAETHEKQIFLDLEDAFAREHTLAEALKSSELALASNRAAYGVGLRINSDVLRAEDIVYTTKRDLARNRYEIVLDHLRLRANAGDLGEDDVRVVDALLHTPMSNASARSRSAP